MVAKYDFFKKVESDEPLAILYNKVLSLAKTVRICSSPLRIDGLKDDDVCRAFYQTCVWEIYCHKSFQRLHDWIEKIDLYEKEFGFSWKYYAASERIRCIKEYGSDEDEDWDSNGNIAIEVSDDNLARYSIVGDLFYEDWIDVVQDIQPEDFAGMYAALSISTQDFFRSVFGKELPMYKQVNGEMVKMSFADHALMEAEESFVKDNVTEAFSFVVCVIKTIVDQLKALDKKSDNIEELKEIRFHARRLLNLGEPDILEEI